MGEGRGEGQLLALVQLLPLTLKPLPVNGERGPTAAPSKAPQSLPNVTAAREAAIQGAYATAGVGALDGRSSPAMTVGKRPPAAPSTDAQKPLDEKCVGLNPPPLAASLSP